MGLFLQNCVKGFFTTFLVLELSIIKVGIWNLQVNSIEPGLTARMCRLVCLYSGGKCFFDRVRVFIVDDYCNSRYTFFIAGDYCNSQYHFLSLGNIVTANITFILGHYFNSQYHFLSWVIILWASITFYRGGLL